MLVQEAIPIQDAFNRQLADMRILYQQANLAAQQQAQHTYRHTFLLTLVLALRRLPWRCDRLAHAAENSLKSQQIANRWWRLNARAALREEATHDPLTGLANRRLFYDRLQQAIRHAHRYGGKVGSCLWISTASRTSTITTDTMWATPC